MPKTKATPILISILAFMAGFPSRGEAQCAAPDVCVWVTTPDQTSLLAEQDPVNFGPDSGPNNLAIDLDLSQKFQEMDGFGASFTDSAAWLVSERLSSEARDELMNRLFDSADGIGLSFLRQPMGATDFSLEDYTYDDMPAGQTDPTLQNFSIQYDRAYILPVLRQALQINPELRVAATPWSAPAWMKTNGSLFGGSLKTDFQTMRAYADYFRRFVEAYEQEGVPIHRITPQNEPLHASGSYPTMTMDAGQQIDFVADHLAPVFQTAGLLGTVEIATYDHNWDNTAYADTVLDDVVARPYVSGSAWHCYAGSPSAMTTIKNAHPDKDVYFTECTAGEWSTSFANNLKWDMQNVIIGATRNWAQSITKWNIALDQDNGPKNDGCGNCRGLVQIDLGGGSPRVSFDRISFNYDYYSLGHISKFVRPGAYRIESNTFDRSIENVAFLNPDGSRVLIALNATGGTKSFKIRRGGSSGFWYTLPPGAVATFVWAAPSVTMNGPSNGAEFPLGEAITVSADPYSDAGIDRVEFYAQPDQGAPTLIGTAASAPYSIEWSSADSGSYALSAEAIDNAGDRIGSDTVEVTVSGGSGDPPNQPPTAAASANPTSGSAPLTVDFTGAGSSDPDGDPLTYDWDFGDGSGHSNAPSPSHSYTSAGSFTATLTVADDGGLTDSSSVTVTVAPAGPATSLHVETIVTGTENLGRGNKRGYATVTIRDDLGAAVQGATVTGDFSGTLAENNVSGTTDAGGTLTLYTSGTARGGVSVSFCVSDVNGPLPYDSGGGYACR